MIIKICDRFKPGRSPFSFELHIENDSTKKITPTSCPCSMGPILNQSALCYKKYIAIVLKIIEAQGKNIFKVCGG